MLQTGFFLHVVVGCSSNTVAANCLPLNRSCGWIHQSYAKKSRSVV